MDALVTDVHIRSVVAGLRGLGRARIPVTAVAPRRHAGGLWSRYAARREVAPDPVDDPAGFSGRVGALAAQSGPFVVYPGREAAIDALLPRTGEPPAGIVLPYPGREPLEALRDKRRLSTLAASAGLGTPEVAFAGPVRDLVADELPLPCAVKPARPGGELRSTVVAGSRAELEALLERLAPDDAVLVQERVSGSLISLALVIDRQGGLSARFQQVAGRTWPAAAGVSSSAVSVAPDDELAERAAAMLAAAGFFGMAQLQFLDAPSGPLLIDVNPRFYGSLPLALAAGVNLPAAWHQVATGEGAPRPRPYRVGVTYRWLEADIVDAYHGEPRLLLRRARRPSAGAVWAADDPVPSVLLAAAAASERIAPKLRRRRG